MPCHQVGTLAAIERVRGELSVQQGREPTVEEIAAVLGVTPEETQSLRVVARHPVSLAAPIGDDQDGQLGDLIEDAEAVSPIEEASQALLRDTVHNVLGSLSQRESRIIALRFGLDDGRQRTLEEVGREFGVTRERIRQIEAKALRKLRHPSRSKKLRDYLR